MRWGSPCLEGGLARGGTHQPFCCGHLCLLAGMAQPSEAFFCCVGGLWLDPLSAPDTLQENF